MRHYNQRDLMTSSDLLRVPWVRRVEENTVLLIITLTVPWYCPSVRKILRYVYPRIPAGLAVMVRREFP